MTATPPPAPTELSAEALEAANALRLERLHPNGHYYQVALALDRFRAAGVREERERAAAMADGPSKIGQIIRGRILRGASP